MSLLLYAQACIWKYSGFAGCEPRGGQDRFSYPILNFKERKKEHVKL